MNNFINIDGKKIGDGCDPFIIAELSANHNGDISRAIEILEMSKKAGADALKIQTYTQDTLTIDSDRDDFLIKGGLWDGRTLYSLYKEAHMPWDWHYELFKKAKEIDITIFSSPFDETAIDFLEDLNAPAYKIASFEAIDLSLIRYAASTNKPLIISTGMADADEISEAVNAAREAGCKQLALLHCVSGYPALPEDYNLATLSDMANRYDAVIGISDHTIDNTTSIAAVALGAKIIEKHVTLNRSDGGPDDSFSLEPNDLRELCMLSKVARKSIGSINYARKESEKGNIVFRRSLYSVKDIKCGEIISKKNVKSIRPGYGLLPKYLDEIVGRKASQDISKGTPISLDLLLE